MTIEIKTKDGNKHIIDQKLRDQIMFAYEHDLTYTYLDGIKVDIEEHSRSDECLVILVRVDV